MGQRVNPASGRLAKFYTCNVCKEAFPGKNIQVNHIKSVIPPTGWDSWDGVVERMFCEKHGLEVVCIPCHKEITKQENEERKNERLV